MLLARCPNCCPPPLISLESLRNVSDDKRAGNPVAWVQYSAVVLPTKTCASRGFAARPTPLGDSVPSCAPISAQSTGTISLSPLLLVGCMSCRIAGFFRFCRPLWLQRKNQRTLVRKRADPRILAAGPRMESRPFHALYVRCQQRDRGTATVDEQTVPPSREFVSRCSIPPPSRLLLAVRPPRKERPAVAECSRRCADSRG